MKTYPLTRTRNLGIIAHIDAGKTTLTERLLWKTGLLHRMGEVHHGNTTMDHMDQERERGITIGSAATQTQWQSKRHDAHRLTLIDTPGHIDFSIEVERSLRVLDGAVAVFCAVAGVQPQSETVWRQAKRHGVPLLAFVNKMDRTGANFNRVLQTMRDRLKANPVAIALPIGQETQFEGLVDLVDQTTWRWQDDQLTVQDWNMDEQAQFSLSRQTLIEAVAEHHDSLLDAYLNGQAISEDQLRHAIRQTTLEGLIVPVLPGTAFKNKGIETLLDAVVDYLPSPLDRQAMPAQSQHGPITIEANPQGPVAGLVFKVAEQQHGSLAFVRLYRGTLKTGMSLMNARTGQSSRVGRLCVVLADQTQDVSVAQAGDIVGVMGWKDARTGDTLCEGTMVQLESIHTHEPVLAWRLSPSKSEDLAKMSTGLERLTKEDPSLRITTDTQTGETVLWGMGELHLDVSVERLRREYGVNLQVGDPKVAYQEKPARAVFDVEGKLSKQTGGKGQFAHIVIHLTPRDDDQVVFVDEIKGGVVSREFIQATEKGMREAFAEGLQGFPVIGATVQLVDGQTHAVDSSAQAFHRAGFMAIKAAFETAGTVVLEPVMTVEVETPADYVGDIVGDLQRRNGQLQSIDEDTASTRLVSLVPLAQLTGYTTSLRSLSQGRASSSLTLHGYAPQIIPAKMGMRL